MRIDVESEKCVEALPKFLDLLKKFGIKASFYVTIGGPSNLLEYLTYRNLSRKTPNICLKYKNGFWEETECKVGKFKLTQRYSIGEMIKLLFQKNFVEENLKIFKRVIKESHELGLHGYKHAPWNHGLYFINVKEHIQAAIEKFENYFGFRPISWASPGFRINKTALIWLNEFGIRIISDLLHEKPLKVRILEKELDIFNVPVTIIGENNIPIIEWLEMNNISDEKKLKIIEDEISKRKLNVMYVHGMFECTKKLDLLKEIFKFLRKNNIPIVRICDVVNIKIFR
jgi:peptidoglycan/xylan/chitin deacetylase (PgdA/CDA1 family)